MAQNSSVSGMLVYIIQRIKPLINVANDANVRLFHRYDVALANSQAATTVWQKLISFIDNSVKT